MAKGKLFECEENVYGLNGDEEIGLVKSDLLGVFSMVEGVVVVEEMGVIEGIGDLRAVKIFGVD